MSEQEAETHEPWRLELIDIPKPCTVPWETMAGGDQVRHCDQCEKNVYNLSSLSARQAQQLLLDHEGRICVSMLKRADGTVVTDECPPLLRPVRDGFKRACAAVAALLAVSVAMLPARAGDDTKGKNSSQCSPQPPDGPDMHRTAGKPVPPQPVKTTNPEPVRLGGAPVAQPPKEEPRRLMGEMMAPPWTLPQVKEYASGIRGKITDTLKAQGLSVKKDLTVEIDVLKDGKVKNCQRTSQSVDAKAEDSVVAAIKKLTFPPPPALGPGYGTDFVQVMVELKAGQ